MTRFTVIWREDALNMLARLWLSAQDKDRVRAADAIDQELAVDAHCKGLRLGGLFRGLVIQPLDVLFAVFEQDRQVHVISVKHAAPPQNGELMRLPTKP